MGPAVLIVTVNPRTSGPIIDSPGLRVVVDNSSGGGALEKLQASLAERGWSRWSSLFPSDREERRRA